ncbi:bifunctional diguanylate cyclase/phosphodiesterase [Rhodobacteraceae bacterium HSP-20]|uniref:Bifunctional diguanylate cyclase/phosphodiesterase n=1 Tax=Paragemmobacter amnigenus TaxID=2852097 RepID=A0ABS6JB53_9RHOB|nr:bifunctional diguanylate cyclase/phosphodiesterase [Rhodobacter amnigenus]MBU9699600.1 bifunctional diguanylate cyclase/phosphodiesterase [Rhodobacter amnigenus]MBV4390827.1 bifunctional diguanylate cyclase/phosphodiesterase [Rhodobacter amnigenus]
MTAMLVDVFTEACRIIGYTKVCLRNYQARIIMNLDLQHSASMTDPLTGLSNRLGVETYLRELPDEITATGVSVVTMELARFGKVNDSLGADLGNKIISTVAKRIQKVFSHADWIARTHGDHFCLVFTGGIDIYEQIELLNDFTQRPLALRGEVIVLSVRIGVSEIGPSVESTSYLLHAAEVALHRAKREQMKRCFFTRNLEHEAKEAHQLENDLRVSLVSNHVELHKAISNNEFKLMYQPIVDVASDTVHAVEALVRWNHPKRGLISPADFIPMAEQIQVMDVLGNWIIRRACSDALTLPTNSDGSHVGVSINISATQFIESEILVSTVKQALEETNIEPQLVKLEITESAAFGSEKIRTIDALRKLGCKTALDDFGTGYSSLTQLNTIPLDYIKLDRSFIAALGGEDQLKDQRSDRITRAVLSIAQTFNLLPVVEGVETSTQCKRLRDYGATLIQGYLFSKPLELDETRKFIENFGKKAQVKGVEHA